MTTLGKGLIIANLVLSAVFFTIALMLGASHKNWKEEATELKRKYDTQVNLRNEAIRDQSQSQLRIRAEQFMRTQQIAASNTQVQNLSEAVNSRTAQLQQETQAREAAEQRLKEAESRIAKQDAEIERMTKVNSELLDRVVAAKNEVVSLTNQRYNLQNQLSLLEAREKSLSQQNAQFAKVIKANSIDPDAPISGIEPRLDGEVASVDRSLNLVVVNLGLDDGLREGHRIEIHRSGKFIGSALVVKSDANRASARLIPESLQRPVQLGDNVTTQF